MDNTSNSTNGSLIKAFNLLEYFSVQKPQWGVRELARHVKANQSTTYRMLSTMESLGVLHKNPDTEKYELGLKLYELGNRVDIKSSFVHLTHPELEKVALDIEETVHLGILNHFKVLMIDKVESVKGLRLESIVGQSSPLHCTGIGKILLAYSDSNSVDRILDSISLTPFTAKTLISKNDLREELEKISAQGYAIDNQEYELGLICVAVPVKNKKNEIVAALSAAGPSDRFRKDAVLEYVETLRKGAEAIKYKIGEYKF